MTPFYCVVFDEGEHFEYTGDAASMRDKVARLTKDSGPGDVEGYERFLKANETTYQVGFEGLGDEPTDAWTDAAKAPPDLINLEAYRTVWSLACKQVSDPRLRVVLTFQSLRVGLIGRQGGRVRCGAKVAQICPGTAAGKRVATGVALADGENLAADVVVSNCDAA